MTCQQYDKQLESRPSIALSAGPSAGAKRREPNAVSREPKAPLPPVGREPKAPPRAVSP